MLSLGEDSTPQQVRDSLERLRDAAGQSVQELRDQGQEKGSVHMLLAKGLEEFAKTEDDFFTKYAGKTLDPDQPINEQTLREQDPEKKAAGRMKISLENLQKEIHGAVREKHERTNTAAENKGPAKSSSPMGKR